MRTCILLKPCKCVCWILLEARNMLITLFNFKTSLASMQSLFKSGTLLLLLYPLYAYVLKSDFMRFFIAQY